MTVQQLHDLLEKIIAEGNGDAEFYIDDTRTGILEECSIYNTINENVTLEDDTVFEKGIPIYLG